MKLGKVILPFLLIGATFSISNIGSTASSSPSITSTNNVLSVETPKVKSATNDDITYIDSSKLSLTATSSSRTDNCQSFQFNFSTTIETYTSSQQTSYIFIDKATNSSDDVTKYNGAVHSLAFNYNYHKIIIPKKLTKTGSFEITPKRILTNATSSILEEGWNNIESIIIPDTIESIPADAITAIEGTKAKICCMCTKEYADQHYEAGWVKNIPDSQITYGYQPTEEESASFEQTVSGSSVEKPSGENFIIGYIGEEAGTKYNLPLTLHYEVKNGSTKKECSIELPITSETKCFDSVGDKLSDKSTILNVDINGLTKDDEIVDGSLYFTNIYRHKVVDNVIIPDTTTQYGLKYTDPISSIKLTQLINSGIKCYSTFAGYTTINATIDKVADAYQVLKPTIYKKYKDEIESGAYTPRYRIISFNLGSYLITYRNANNELVTKKMKINAPIDYLNFSKDKGNVLGVTIKNSDVGSDFTPNRLVSFSLSGISFSMDLWANESDAIVAKTAGSLRFGNINLFGDKTAEQVRFHNINTLYAVIMSAFIAVFAALSTALFFYQKKKYRNDEFKRVKPKKFVLSALGYLVVSSLVLLSVISIVFRWTIFNTTIVSFNPLDVMVVIFTIAGAIALGFFIKDMVVRYKNYRSNKEKRLLKLDKDVVEDGTK